MEGEGRRRKNMYIVNDLIFVYEGAQKVPFVMT